jgi:hypothetical protein
VQHIGSPTLIIWRNVNKARIRTLIVTGLLAGSVVAGTPAPANAASYSTSCQTSGSPYAWSSNFYQTDGGDWRIDLYGTRKGGFNAHEVDYWRVEMTDGNGWTMRTYYAQGDGRDSVRITNNTLNLRSPVGDGVMDTLRIKTQFRVNNAADKSCIYERNFRR